ncbi:hypothetical protein EH223_04040 [candidate division KSB1 bacterium]|nr:hypothetical protein [candidate division KSB1 bacterium]RQW05654.1 MAG: hypothetical protein EH223_04040 [candidate division KSB1 bacterium]
MNWTMATHLPVKLALIDLRGLNVKENSAAYKRLCECAERYAELYVSIPISEIPGVQQARLFFRAIGIDPTKRRPSSEALLHRALKNKPLYSVNNLVDVGNWCSLDFLLPTCIYDADKIAGQVTIRLGRVGESYLALNGREIDFAGRFVLVNSFAPFGSPMIDSQRTAVSQQTKNAILGIWAPDSIDPRELQEQAELFGERAVQYCGGVQHDIKII